MPRMITMDGYKIVLTADRTMMSNYGGGLFSGFISTGPSKGFLPLPFLLNFIFKPVQTTKDDRAVLAPHGLRRIEAALLVNGFKEEDVVVTTPEKLERVIGSDTMIIGVHSHDHLGRGPASTTMSGPTGIIHYEPLSAWGFKNLVRSKVVRKARENGALIVAGGPGAWQFTLRDLERLGVDLVVRGEGEIFVPRLFKDILNGVETETPRIIDVPFHQIPNGNMVPVLRGATIGGLVEVSRGCGRGCSFCRATLRPLRHRCIEDIKRDVEVNVKFGQRGICLHAEDIFRYGAKPLEVRHGKVVKLFKEVSSVPGARVNSFSHANLSSIAGYPETVKAVSELIGCNYGNWAGYETGIETGSERLIERHMRFKPYPFKPEEWREVVVNAFGISVDNGFVPAATLIVNLPGEEERDVLKTIELVEDLKTYKSLIVPLLYVNPFNSLIKGMRFLEDAEWYHLELYRVIWKHNLKWLPRLVFEYTKHNSLQAKLFLRGFVLFLKFFVERRTESLLSLMLNEKIRSKAPCLEKEVKALVK